MTEIARKNGDTPATQADLALLAGEMTSRFDGVNAELEELKGEVYGIAHQLREARRDISGVHHFQKSLLNEVTLIREQLGELKSLSARVESLEQSRG